MADKPLLSGFEKIILIGLIAFFGYQFFKNGSFRIMEKTEEVTILDGKTSSKKYKELDRKEKEKPIEKRDGWNKKSGEKLNTDNVLGKLARTYSKGREETARQMKEMGLSDDEIKYFNEVKEEETLTEKISSAKDWFQFLKTSASTYGKVKTFVNELGGTESSDVNELLEDRKSSNEFYENLEKAFGISETEAKAFSSLGKKKISDWAKFIEEKSKEE